MDVVGFGAINLDKIYLVDKIPKADEEGFVKDLQLFPGGSAANTIVGLSRLGLKTGYVGKVGNDGDGKTLLQDFQNEGVDTSAVIISEGRSGNALIFVDEEGNRAILVDPGVNDTIKFEEIDVDLIKKYRIMHLTSFICKNGLDSLNSQKKIVKEMEKVSFDPGMVYAERGLDDIGEILKYTTVFLPNRSEIELLFGMEYREAAESCIEMGIDVVVVKMGSEGCYIKTRNRETFIKALKVEVVDTTGAGDAFNAGFLYGYLKGRDVEECGKLGNIVASHCIQKVGARSGLPIENELF
jgi:ribokinase